MLPFGLLLLLVLSGRTERQALHLTLKAVFLISLGFSASVFREAIVAAPVLQKRITVEIVGTVTQKSSDIGVARIKLENLKFPEGSIKSNLMAVRLSVRSGLKELHPGMRIQARVVLLPPPMPAYAGGFDFQRYAYFQSIGATGYAIGAYEVLKEDTSFWLLLKGLSAKARDSIATYIKERGPPNTAGFAIAIMTGDKGAIPVQQLEDMRHSGLAHLLAISGLHMGMIGGLIFFLSRFLFACWPTVALNYPIKKMAAVITLFGLVCYLFVSGMSVSAIRAFIMISAFFIAVCFDRTALSFRMVVLAALIIMLVFPESLLSASFQMSFAAVFALIALYEKLGPSLNRLARSGRVFRKLSAYSLGIALTSLIAGLATAPFAVYHFGQMATFSLAANLFAVPIMGLWVMPWAIATFLTLFLPWSFPLEMMGHGIDAILLIANETASWPQSVQFFGTYSPVLLIGFILAALWWMIWRQPIRWLAFPIILPITFAFLETEKPLAIISNSGNLFAVWEEEKAPYFSSQSIDRFSAKKWTLVLGKQDPEGQMEGVACDSYGCVYSKQGVTIGFPENQQALMEDCQRATVIMSRVPIYIACPKPVLKIDKFDLWRQGSHSLYRGPGDSFRVETVNGVRGQRPWVPLRSRN